MPASAQARASVHHARGFACAHLVAVCVSVSLHVEGGVRGLRRVSALR